MTAVVGIVNRYGLRIAVCHSNQPNKTKLSLYKCYFHFSNHLKQLYISNRMERFSYKGGCGICVSRYLKNSWFRPYMN